MKISANTMRIGIAAVIIVGTIGWLAYSGVAANESYYKNISELRDMGDKAYKSNLKCTALFNPAPSCPTDPTSPL